MSTYTNTTTSTDLTEAVGGVAPGAGDTLKLVKDSVNYQAGITLTGTLAAIIATSGFSGAFDPNPLVAAVTTLTMQWSGPVWRHSGNIGTAILDAAYGGMFAPVSGTTSNYYGKSGTGYFVDSAIVTNGWVAAPVGRSTQATFKPCSTAITALNVGNNATVQLERDVGTLNIDGGDTTIDSTTCTPTTVNLRNGVLRPKTMGTGGTLNGLNGILDLRQLKNDIAFGTSNIYPGLTIYMPPAGITVDFGTRTDFGGGPLVK